MENVQAAIATPSPATAKASAAEAPVDDNGAPLPSAFLAVLTAQVKSLKVGSSPARMALTRARPTRIPPPA